MPIEQRRGPLVPFGIGRQRWKLKESVRRSLEAVPLPVEPNSTIYWFATHPADPNVIVANSLNSYVYTSSDGGDSWKKMKQELGEVRALAWVPN